MKFNLLKNEVSLGGPQSTTISILWLCIPIALFYLFVLVYDSGEFWLFLFIIGTFILHGFIFEKVELKLIKRKVIGTLGFHPTYLDWQAGKKMELEYKDIESLGINYNYIRGERLRANSKKSL